MSRPAVMARLAMRELWISFRLFAIIATFIAAGALVVFLPTPLPRTMGTLAVALGVATAVTAAVSAWSMAEERQAGRAGWLVTRSLSRGTLLAGWFVAVGGIGLVALAAAGVLGWLAASAVTLRLEPAGYISLLGGVAGALLAAVAIGLTAGIVAGPRRAALLALLVCVAAGVAAWVLPGDASRLPGGAFGALGALSEPGTAIGPGLRAAGIGLACAAGVLVLARLLLDRAEL